MNNNKNDANCQSTVCFVVYVIWDIKNNKYYVGVTRQKQVYTRIRQHKRGKQFVDRELQQVGWENCDWWIVEENIPDNLITEREQFWINEFNSKFPNGYNLTIGGISKFIVTEETREKIRQNALARGMSGENNPMYGHTHTAEAKAAQSEKMSGENNPMYGKSPTNKGVPHTPEELAKMSAAQTGEKNGFYGKHHTEESKEKNRQAHLGKPSPRKDVHLSESTKAKIRAKALERDISGANNPFYGKHHSEETKAILSAKLSGENSPMYGKHHSEEARAKMSESAKARWAKKKAAKDSD